METFGEKRPVGYLSNRWDVYFINLFIGITILSLEFTMPMSSTQLYRHSQTIPTIRHFAIFQEL